MVPDNNFNTNATHPNYKRVVVAITLFFVIVVLGMIAYQYGVDKKKITRTHQEQVLQEQINRIEDAKVYFSSLPPRTQETADKDRNASKEFFKNSTSPSNTIIDADTKAFFEKSL